MKKVSFIRAIFSFLVLLSIVAAGLSQATANAQERVGQERQVQARDSKTEVAQKQEARKATGDKGNLLPVICNDCDPPPPPPPPPGGGGGDGHIWCSGWDRQGDCVFNHVSAVTSVELRRQMGNNGYNWQTFLTWFPWETDGFGRFPVADGNAGLISTSALAGQVALHRWSTTKGFYYSTYYAEYGGDYVYGGIAGYVWPAGDTRGFPLYQFYSQEYGHYYTNYRSEIDCQPHVYWDDQGAMARVNFPAPFTQAFRQCRSLVFPGPCDPFARFRCELRGGFIITGTCGCSDGLP